MQVPRKAGPNIRCIRRPYMHVFCFVAQKKNTNFVLTISFKNNSAVWTVMHRVTSRWVACCHNPAMLPKGERPTIKVCLLMKPAFWARFKGFGPFFHTSWAHIYYGQLCYGKAEAQSRLTASPMMLGSRCASAQARKVRS